VLCYLAKVIPPTLRTAVSLARGMLSLNAEMLTVTPLARVQIAVMHSPLVVGVKW